MTHRPTLAFAPLSPSIPDEVHGNVITQVLIWAIMARFFIVLILAGATLIATAGPASANNGPYVGQGYDASSYQCTKGVPAALDPAFTSFGIVRVTGGRPFTVDSCRAALWKQAATGSSGPSLYVNVAYSGAYGHQVSGFCSTATSPEGYSGKYLQAYRIGCAESNFAFGQVNTGTVTPVAWWLDVETGNSWSSSDRVLNQAAIDGAADRLKFQSGVFVGVYSYPSAWDTITTGSRFQPASASGSWVAGAADCTVTFSVGLLPWLRQSGKTATGADADYAC